MTARRGRVLIVSPHFPPDASAATHRVRLLAPHLPTWGWEPTIVTVDPRDYEGRLDTELAGLLPAALRVVRTRAWPSRWTRAVRVGDLGLRAFTGLRRGCAALMAAERFDALFITTYPVYPALLGPMLKRRFGVPFVLDVQDPWVGAWGDTVGGGAGGAPDLKSRLARAAALRLEPRVARAADAITAVSAGTYEQIRDRHGGLERTPCVVIPVGAEPADFERARRCPRPNSWFDPSDGAVHLCSMGTLLPLGVETLRAVLEALAQLRRHAPDLYARVRLHAIGTGNQTSPGAPCRVLPLARELGVDDRVTEVAHRIPYLDAIAVQLQASALLLIGSSEPHYTASRLYPALLAERPILAVYHEASSVVGIMRRALRPPSGRLVTYGGASGPGDRVEPIRRALAELIDRPEYCREAVDPAVVAEFSARSLARALAGVLDQVASRS